MTDLTDKWKKGELTEGWYYVKGSRAEGIYAYTAEYLNNMYRPRNGEKIIEQVPSYDEYVSLINWKEDLTNLCTAKERIIKKYENIDTWWQAENTKFKNLLKEVRGKLKYINTPRNNHNIFENDLIKKINQALGEDK